MQTMTDIIKSEEDYCIDVGERIGLCRIKGRAKKQQDFIAYEEKENPVFQSLSFDNKVGLLERVIAKIQDQNKQYQRSGSTLSACFNSHNLETHIFRTQLTNVGDGSNFLVILNDDGSIFELSRLNLLHNPDPQKNIGEYRRVERVAGVVKPDTYRLSGPNGYRLMLSRTIGDSSAKPFGLSHIPEIYEATRILSPGQFGMTINASDGLETLSLNDMSAIISEWACNKKTLSHLARCLVVAAYEKKSHDNISVGIILGQGSVLIADGHGDQGELVANNSASEFYPQLDCHSPRISGPYALPYYSKFFNHSPPEDDTIFFLKVALTWMLKVWLHNKKPRLYEVEKWLGDAEKIEEFVTQLASDPSFFILKDKTGEKDRLISNHNPYDSPISFFIDNTCLNFTMSVFLNEWHKKKPQEQSKLITLSIAQFLQLFHKDLYEITHKAWLISGMIERLQTSIKVPNKKIGMMKRFFMSSQARTYSPEETLLSSLNEHARFNYLSLDIEYAKFAIDSRIEALNNMLERCKNHKHEYEHAQRDQLEALKLMPWSQLYNTPCTPDEYARFKQRKQEEIDNPEYDFIYESSL